jgi:hypothetical protein
VSKEKSIDLLVIDFHPTGDPFLMPGDPFGSPLPILKKMPEGFPLRNMRR